MFSLNKKSISEQLIDHYKQEIESGKLKPGDEFPSERTLEKQLGISRRTINKVITALASLGYLFKEQGRTTYVTDSYRMMTQLPTGKTIGVHFATAEDVYHPSLAPIFMELCKCVQSSPYSMELIFDKNRDLRNLKKQVSDKQLAGLVFMDVAYVQEEVIATLNVPSIVFGSELRNFASTCTFGYFAFDSQMALCEATRYLANAGCRQIGFINGNDEWPLDVRRREMFKSTLLELGKEYDNALVRDSHYEKKMTLDALNVMLEHKTDAIICADDMVARWVVDELAKRNIKVPEQVAVIGFNDMPMFSQREEMPLTTFAIPAEKLAQAGAAELFKKMNDPNYVMQAQKLTMPFCKRTTA